MNAGQKISGIDDFLAEAILDEISDFSNENYLPAGDLHFNIAANSEVSSSPFIFKMITKILLNNICFNIIFL